MPALNYITYIQKHKRIKLLVPPNNFNPKKAINEQLAEYGLPARPSDPALLKDWEKEIKNFKHAVKPSKAYVKKNTSNTTTTDKIDIWAGTIDCISTDTASSGASSSTGLFQCVDGSWTQPTINNQSTTSAESTWVGIGGYYNPSLIQCGTSSDNSGGYYAWYEYLGTSQSIAAKPLALTVKAGDSVTAVVSYNGYSAAFAVSDNGSYASMSVQNISDCYYGGTAEWIVERPTNHSTQLPYDLASFTGVAFSGCSAYTNKTNVGSTAGVTYPMNTFSEIQVSMYKKVSDPTTLLAFPVVSSYTANSFVVNHN